LSHQKNKVVSEKLCLGQDSETVLQQTEEWLNEIFDGAKVALKAERDTISMSYNTKHTPNRYKPSNVGFGYSYILPIIVSGLIARDGEILIVENPEAHLHPAAQSRLTKFLAKVASCGVQVFIETHSEHILNALRVVSVSKDYEIKNTDISILYFQNDENQLVTPIPINPDGGIDTWPDGFFDQTDKDFKILFGF
jgi:predicted ATPase